MYNKPFSICLIVQWKGQNAINIEITVKELLKHETFLTADIICNKRSILNNVNTVTIMDIPDIVEWIHPKELIIMGRFMETHFDTEFIKQLADKGISGIISKKKFKKFVTEETIEASQHYNIPMIFVDNKFAWSEVTSTVQKLQSDKQVNILKETEMFHRMLLKYLRTNKGLNDLCSSIQEVTDLSIALADQNLNLIDQSYGFNWKEAITSLSSQDLRHKELLGYTLNQRLVQGYRYHCLENDEQNQLILIKNDEVRDEIFYLILKVPETTNVIQADILSKVETIQSIYHLKKSFYQDVIKTNLIYKDLAFEELLELTEPAPKSRSKFSLILGQRLEEHYQVVLIKNLNTYDNSDKIKKIKLFSEFSEQFYDSYFTNENTLIFSKNDYWVLLIGDSQKDLELFVHSLTNFLEAFLNHSRFYIGIGDRYPYYQLKSSWTEAEHSVLFLEKSNASDKYQFYKKLGILKLFTDESGSVNQLFIDQIRDRFLKPILEYDAEQSGELYLTLQSYFENNFSHNKTSDLLFIHKNTLRARLKKIESLLNVNLKNSNDLMNIYLAMRLNQMKSPLESEQ